MLKQTIYDLKKIKTNKKTKFIIVSFLSMLLISNTSIANNPNTHTQTSVYSQNNGMPLGFISVINDYEKVRGQMIQSIAKGQGEHWKRWLQEGLNTNDSLYWWLLSEWHYQHNNIEQAYSSAVQAMLFSKMEASSCSANKTALKDTIDRFIANHHYQQITSAQNNSTREKAIIESVYRAEYMLTNKNHSIGSMCFLVMLEKEKGKKKNSRSKSRPVKLELGYEKEIILDRQKKELNKFKEEVSYDIIWKNANINTIWQKKQGVREI